MKTDKRNDIISGLMLLAFGVGVTLFAIAEYRVGTLLRAGPGLFPAIIGVVMALLGAAISVGGILRSNSIQGTNGASAEATVEMRALLAILGSIGIFALLVDNFGILPAILAQVLVAAFAQERIRLLHTIILAPILAVMAILIFKVLLGVPFDILKLPG